MNNVLKMVYKPDKQKSLRIFGHEFLKRNKNRCKIRYEKTIYELQEYLEDIDNNFNSEAENIELELIFIQNTQDLSYMFCDCSQLISVSKHYIENSIYSDDEETKVKTVKELFE